MAGTRRDKGHGGRKSQDVDYSLGDTGGAVDGGGSGVDDEVCLCGACGVDIGNEDSLECELCVVWTHGAQKCSGLLYSAFKTIIDFSKKRRLLCLYCLLSLSWPRCQQTYSW